MTPERTDDVVLTTEQNWAAQSHRELYNAVHQNNNPGKSGEIGWHWEQIGAQLSESAQAISKGITATESGWTGASAEAARAAIRLLAQWVTETARNASGLGARVQDESRIMEMARAAMPEPVEFNWDAAAGTLSGPGIASFAASAADVQAANEQARAAHEQAVRVMTEMERQSRAVDETTPHFTAPFNPTTGRAQVPQPVPPGAEGAQSLRGAAASPEGNAKSGASPAPPPQVSAPEGDSAQQMLAASATVTSGHFGPGPAVPPEQGSPAGQHYSGHQGGTAAASAAAAAAGAGVGAYAARGGKSDESSRQTRPAVAGNPGGFAVVPGTEPSLDAGSRSGGQQPSKTVPQQPSTSQHGFAGPAGGTPPPLAPVAGPTGGTPPAAPGSGGGGRGGRPGGFGGAGGAGGAGGMGGMPNMAKGKPQNSDVKLPGGMSAGMTDFSDGPEHADSLRPNASGVVGGSSGGPKSTSPMEGGGAPPPGGMARSAGAEDTERKTAYVQSEDLFDVPGEDLPPSVIGGRKSPKGGDSS